MPRYFLEVTYDGTRYAGWQRQSRHQTVQQELENALENIYGVAIPVTGSGRTDAGVHAVRQYAHVDLPQKDANNPRWIKRFQALLARDIYIGAVIPVHHDAHARFDAIARQYRYDLAVKPDIFHDRYTWVIKTIPDMAVLERLVQSLHGEHDFASFSKFSPDIAHSRCQVVLSELIHHNDTRFSIRIRANRFLHHMVRSLTGCMVKAAIGRIAEADVHAMLAHPDHANPTFTAPAHALFLEDVLYRPGYFHT